MSYDFPSYIADLTLAAQDARNKGSTGSAAMLDDQLSFAIKEAVKADVLGSHDQFRSSVAHRVVERGGANLYPILTGASLSGGSVTESTDD